MDAPPPVIGQKLDAPAPTPAFGEAARFWLKLGFINFGGPTGQIALMHREIVEKRRWVDEPHFLDALNFCMLLPGPEAQQLATYLGWLLHRTRGALTAVILFVLPAAVLLWGLSWMYMVYGQVAWLAAVLRGLQACVLAIVASALLRIGRRVLRSRFHWTMAVAAFLALQFLGTPFPLLIAMVALLSWLAGQRHPQWFSRPEEKTSSTEKVLPTRRSAWRIVRVLLLGLAIWWTPLVLAGLALGWSSVWWQEGVFFSQAALVTFGGAYAVLPYVAQQAVTQFGWLTLSQMMSGLALAETTPGPLIIVLEFVGFVGAWQNHGPLSPLMAGTLGAAVTVWATFAPSILFIFLGAPEIERLRHRPALQAALSGVTAAVVGVIFNLGIWFAWHTLWPNGRGVDFFAAAVAGLSFAALQWGKWDLGWVVVLGAVAGLAGHAWAGW
jgi:chromate transporter